MKKFILSFLLLFIIFGMSVHAAPVALPEWNESLFTPIREGDSYYWYTNGQIAGYTDANNKARAIEEQIYSEKHQRFLDGHYAGMSIRWVETLEEIGEYEIKDLYPGYCLNGGKNNGMLVFKLTRTAVVTFF